MFEEKRDVIVTASHPASSRATNCLQNTTKSQQRQNTAKIVSEEYTNIRRGEQNLREVSKIIQDAYERIFFWKKTLFMLTTSAAAKNYKTGAAKLMSSWKNNVLLKDILSRSYISCTEFFFKS